jgi:hypothetical protein
VLGCLNGLQTSVLSLPNGMEAVLCGTDAPQQA